MRIVDFDNLDQHKDAFLDADMAFSCLGTTRAKAGADGFVKVDYDYIVNAANILKEHGQCKGFHLVSSSGRYIPFIIPLIALYIFIHICIRYATNVSILTFCRCFKFLQFSLSRNKRKNGECCYRRRLSKHCNLSARRSDNTRRPK